jgi:alcohol dehydrogenase class IV
MNPVLFKDPLRPFGVEQKIYQGSGAIQRIPEILKAEGWKRVMLVIDPAS